MAQTPGRSIEKTDNCRAFWRWLGFFNFYPEVSLESANLTIESPHFLMYLGNQPTVFFFIYAVSKGSRMEPVLYFGCGCLFPLYLFRLSFIVIHSFFFSKCLGLKKGGIHSLILFLV